MTVETGTGPVMGEPGDGWKSIPMDEAEEDVSSRAHLSRTTQEPPSPDNLKTGKEG